MPPQPIPLEIDCRSVHELGRSGEPFLLLDCREPDEFAAARLAGSVLIPMGELRDRVGELEASRTGRVVVHCHHGGRSLRVAMWLRQQGFPHAQSMSGGIEQWSLEIDPTVPRY